MKKKFLVFYGTKSSGPVDYVETESISADNAKKNCRRFLQDKYKGRAKELIIMGAEEVKLWQK